MTLQLISQLVQRFKAASLWRATRARLQERRHQRQLSPRARIARALPLQLKVLKLIAVKVAESL
ncbi:MAG TPA: hypothetical protein VGL25_09380 [Casimicrobiaceae bacterium]